MKEANRVEEDPIMRKLAKVIEEVFLKKREQNLSRFEVDGTSARRRCS